MEIKAVRLTTKQSRGPGDTLAYFDVQITPEFKVKNLMLRQREDGSYRVSAPHAFGTSTCTFMPDTARELTTAALEAYRNYITGTDRAFHERTESA